MDVGAIIQMPSYSWSHGHMQLEMIKWRKGMQNDSDQNPRGMREESQLEKTKTANKMIKDNNSGPGLPGKMSGILKRINDCWQNHAMIMEVDQEEDG